jgi:hypothetical protein
MSDDDKSKRPEHAPTNCVVRPGDNFFSGRSSRHCGQWVPRFTCPECGRQMRMASNYLGGGDLICTGTKFLKPHQQTLRHRVEAHDRRKRDHDIA